MTFHQVEHPLLVIPGPIEVSDDVLFANASPSQSHMSKSFAETFGGAIKMFRQVLLTKNGQPFIVAGSGTLGWDMVASNLMELGDEALVLQSGTFGQRFADCFEAYGAKVTQIIAPIGQYPSREQLTEALKANKYKVVTVTHVDTSTGVLSNPQMVAEVVREVSPDTLVILDGVCSVGSEEIRMDEWSLDVVICASQKGLGVPPGLCLACASERAINVVETRKTKINSYFASWLRWLPVMRGYEQGKPAYFATPPIQLICALHASLKDITSRPIEERWAKHKQASIDLKQFVTNELGLKQVPNDPSMAANGMTAIYFPDGLSPSDIIPRLLELGIVVSGSLHKDITDKYFRIGHMGITVTDTTIRHDLDKIKDALRNVFNAVGYVNKSGRESWIDLSTNLIYDDTTDGRYRIGRSEIVHGGQWIMNVKADLLTIPLFARAGSIIPLIDPSVFTLNHGQPISIYDRSYILHLWIFLNEQNEANGLVWDELNIQISSCNLNKSLCINIDDPSHKLLILQLPFDKPANSILYNSTQSFE